MGMPVRMGMPMVVVIVIMGVAWHARIIPFIPFSAAIRPCVVTEPAQ